MMRGFVLRVCLIQRTNDKWIMLWLLIKQHFHVFFKEKKCSNGRVERLTQGLWGLALYYHVFLLKQRHIHSQSGMKVVYRTDFIEWIG